MFPRQVFIAILVIASSLFFISCDTPKEEIAKANYIDYKGVRYPVVDAVFRESILQNDGMGDFYQWIVEIATEGLEYSDGWNGTGNLLTLQITRYADSYTGMYIDISTYNASRTAIGYPPGIIMSSDFTLNFDDDGQLIRSMIEDSGNIITVVESGGIYTVNITVLVADGEDGSTTLKGFFTGSIEHITPIEP